MVTKKSAYDMEYQKKHISRIAVDCQKEDKIIYEAVAEEEGMKLATWVKNLMSKRARELGYSIPSQDK